jgi:hypothetical protein
MFRGHRARWGEKTNLLNLGLDVIRYKRVVTIRLLKERCMAGGGELHPTDLRDSFEEWHDSLV